MRWTPPVSRTLLVSCAVVVTVGLMSASRPAGAAVISSIRYDITGGEFGFLFPGYLGPITGVSATYTPPGGPVSTPFNCYIPGGCGWLDLHLTGPSLTSLASTMLYVDLHTAFIDPNFFQASFDFSLPEYSILVIWRIHATSVVGSGHIGYKTYPTGLGISYTIGNEIRLPEPSTHLALGFGVALLGALAALRTRRRARPL